MPYSRSARPCRPGSRDHQRVRLTDLDPQILASALWLEALTHRSAGSRHNERLEFLGDSVLSLVVTEHIHAALPEANEGELSRLRASLVNKEALAEIAKELGVGEVIRLGPGELKSGGFRRNSILADALEAVIGAVYLVKGLEAAREFITRIYGERLSQPPASLGGLKDPKSRLQELLQGRGLPLPEYRVTEVKGDPHNQTFTAACLVSDLRVEAVGQGTSRRKAEQDAAARALAQIEGGSGEGA